MLGRQTYVGGACIIVILFTEFFSLYFMFGDSTFLSSNLLILTTKSFSIDEIWENSIPSQCNEFWIKPGEFPTLEDILDRGVTEGDDVNGGNWTPCTSLMLYGFTYHTSFGEFIAHVLQPKSVLEFGCGLGQQSDFLSRFIPGGSDVTCIEPEPMFAEVFDRRAPPNKPKQLAINVFKPDSKRCVDALKIWKRDLVVSTEVAEHIPSEYHEQMVELLSKMTGKFLVFSAGRPEQKGHGHIEESSLDKVEWISRFEKYGLRFSRRYSHLIAFSVWGQRNYDIFANVFVMLAPGVNDISFDEIPPGYRIIDPSYLVKQSLFLLNKRTYVPWNNETAEVSDDRVEMREASGHLLWPEMYLIVNRLKNKEISCK